MVSYPFFTCRCLLAAGAFVPNTAAARPLSTERSVEDDLLLLECILDIAGTGELGSRLTPAAGVWAVTEDVFRDGVAGEEVNADGVGGPLSCIYTTTAFVQACTVALSRWMFDGASRVLRLVLGSDITVSCNHRARELGSVFANLATRTCVEGHAVVCLIVHAFDDVNLAILWPVGTSGPESVDI
jgi:hypothetical protein